MMEGAGNHAHGGLHSSTAEKLSCASSLALVEPEGPASRSTQLDTQQPYRPFETLPKGLLPNVTAYLDMVFVICLRGTNFYFYHTIEANRTAHTNCMKWLLYCYFRRYTPLSKQSSVMTCALCLKLAIETTI